VLPCVGSERESAKQVLVTLIKHITATMHSTAEAE
jgi:hypothetical protein